MSKVFCFGELLLRLSPEGQGRWIEQHSMPVFVGGAELNVATALARWGSSSSYCTRLPDHYLSMEIVGHLASLGIDTSSVQYGGERIGTYYLRQGGDLKQGGVIYDRAYSSFSALQPGQLDWESLLQDAGWFHFSAITPALSPSLAAVCEEGVSAARAKGLPVSVDLNYRGRLWQDGRDPRDVLPALVEGCTLVMGNLWAADKMLGIAVPFEGVQSKEAYLQAAAALGSAIRKQFPTCLQVANTFRFDVEEGLHYYAALETAAGSFVSREYQSSRVVDRVGSGDAFMAGLIHANRSMFNEQETIDFAAAAAFTKLFIRGDATTAMVAEIRKQFEQYVH
jgi:2-dehydro-3-deoxygluconokinase